MLGSLPPARCWHAACRPGAEAHEMALVDLLKTNCGQSLHAEDAIDEGQVFEAVVPARVGKRNAQYAR